MTRLLGTNLQLASPSELFEPDEFEAIERAANDPKRDPIMRIERRQVRNLCAEVRRLRATQIVTQ